MRIRSWLREPRHRWPVVAAVVILIGLAANRWRGPAVLPPSASRPGQARDTLAGIEAPGLPGRLPSRDGRDLTSAVAHCRKDGPGREGETQAPSPVDFSAAEEVLAGMARELSNRPAPADRALGAYASMVAEGQKAQIDFESKHPGCAEQEECRALEPQAVEQAAGPYREGLARLATTSNRAEVYALAFFACQSIDAPPSGGQCSQLSADQWTRLEPDNAVPWLYAAAAAAKRGDPAAADEAIFRASQARSSDTHWSALSGLVRSPAWKAQPLEMQVALDAAVVGMTAAVSYPPYQTASKYCSLDAIKDPSRHQICADLATMLTERSDTLLSLALGTKMAERLDWPPDRLEALRNRKDAAFEIARRNGGNDLQDCESMRRILPWVENMLHYGELGALRRAIAASGRSESQLAQALRAVQRQSADLAKAKSGAQ
jgi:hypothetical protein